MSEQVHSKRVVVVCDRSQPDADKVQALLDRTGVTDAQWFAPRDVDDVDTTVRAGGVERVVFGGLREFLDAAWDDEIAPTAWHELGVRVEFAGPPGEDSNAIIAAVCQNWASWRRRHRQRQAVAGVLLSAVAIVAAFVIIWAAR